MNDELESYSQAINQLGTAVTCQCTDSSEVKIVKHVVQNSYSSLAHILGDKTFLNWGLYNKKIHNEYAALGFNFSEICTSLDDYSQTLVYYLIRPLVKNHFFNKRFLEVGCGNGIGLKISSQLLATEYALGVDLVHKLASNARGNFYQENKINFIQSDAEILPLENESFDIITNVESSHLYPQVACFFSEVERVLAPGGFFCYADIHATQKQQTRKLDEFIRSHPNLKVLQKVNITRWVQASLYQRLIVNEDKFYEHAYKFFGEDKVKLMAEFTSWTYAKGLPFLPWWKIRFKNPELQQLEKRARSEKFWGKKCFFYYLIQKAK